jgi:hypothetical protein
MERELGVSIAVLYVMIDVGAAADACGADAVSQDHPQKISILATCVHLGPPKCGTRYFVLV